MHVQLYDQLNFRYLLNVLLFTFCQNKNYGAQFDTIRYCSIENYFRKKSCCKNISHHIHFPPSSISISYFNQSTKRTCKNLLNVLVKQGSELESMRQAWAIRALAPISSVLSTKRQNKHLRLNSILISISYFQVDTNKVRTCNKFFLTENQSSSTIWDTVSTVTTIRSESFKPHFCDKCLQARLEINLMRRVTKVSRI